MCVPPVPRIGSPVRGEMKHNKTHNKKADAPAEVREYRETLLQIGAQHPAWSSNPQDHLVRIFNGITAQAREAVGAIGDDDDAKADWCESQSAKAAPAEMREVTEQEWNEASAVAQDRVRLGRLRSYLLPILAQQSKNIANAAASGISDFEAMKRSKEMLNRIESEEAAQ